MGTHQPAHQGQLLASQRRTDSPASDHHCTFCGTAIALETDEHVEHCLSTEGDQSQRRERYCSPSCFIRGVQQAGSVGDTE